MSRNGKAPIAVANDKSAGVERQMQLSLLQLVAIGLPQNRKQDLVLKLGPRGGSPGNVKKARVGGCWPVFQDIVPPGVVISGHTHVIGHDVEDLAETVLGKS